MEIEVSEGGACCGEHVSVREGPLGGQIVQLSVIWVKAPGEPKADATTLCREMLPDQEARNREVTQASLDDSASWICRQDVYQTEIGLHTGSTWDFWIGLSSGGAVEGFASRLIDKDDAVNDLREEMIRRMILSVSVN
jgi:hypothetical protein